MPADRGKTDRRDCEIKQEQEKKDDISVCMEAVDPGHGGLYRPGNGIRNAARGKGYGVFWAIAMSVFIYAGSMQYVAIDLITGGASLISAALMTLMVNARHLFYGISMVERYKDTKPYKPYLIFALTDETYSLVCSGGCAGRRGGEKILLSGIAAGSDLLGYSERCLAQYSEAC